MYSLTNALGAELFAEMMMESNMLRIFVIIKRVQETTFIEKMSICD